AVSDNGNRVPGLDTRADSGVVPGREDVGERKERRQHLVRVTRPRYREQTAVGKRDAYRLTLATVAVHRVEAAVHARGRDPVSAMRARPVAVRERRDDEVALLDVVDIRADVLDHADELVSDRAGLERRVAAVVPEVGAADTAEDDADDRVGPLVDRGVTAVGDGDPAGFVEDGCA